MAENLEKSQNQVLENDQLNKIDASDVVFHMDEYKNETQSQNSPREFKYLTQKDMINLLENVTLNDSNAEQKIKKILNIAYSDNEQQIFSDALYDTFNWLKTFLKKFDTYETLQNQEKLDLLRLSLLLDITKESYIHEEFWYNRCGHYCDEAIEAQTNIARCTWGIRAIILGNYNTRINRDTKVDE